MNKLTLILQDKSVITELAQDESVKIRIADAIIDGVRKRSSKVTEGIAQSIAKELEAELYDRNMWSKTLSAKVQKKIASEASSIVSDLVQEEASKIREEVLLELHDLRLSIRKDIESMKIEPIIEKYVRQVIREKFYM